MTGPVTNPARAAPPIAPRRSETPSSSSDAMSARAGGKKRPLAAPETSRAKMKMTSDDPPAKRALPRTAKVVPIINSRFA